MEKVDGLGMNSVLKKILSAQLNHAFSQIHSKELEWIVNSYSRGLNKVQMLG